MYRHYSRVLLPPPPSNPTRNEILAALRFATAAAAATRCITPRRYPPKTRCRRHTFIMATRYYFVIVVFTPKFSARHAPALLLLILNVNIRARSHAHTRARRVRTHTHILLYRYDDGTHTHNTYTRHRSFIRIIGDNSACVYDVLFFSSLLLVTYIIN